MALINNYWTHREQEFPSVKAWCRAWGKRALSLCTLISADFRLCNMRKRGANIGRFTFISPAKFQGPAANFSVGNSSFIGRVFIQLHAPVTIGNFVCINDGVSVYSASHDIRDPEWPMVAGNVIIENYVWIASGATILPGVRIGEGAVIAAGAVVSKSVPAGACAAGNPAVIREGVRPAALCYSPVSFLAVQRAWLGTTKE